VQARLSPEAFKKLKYFYDEVRYKVTPDSLGKHDWYAVVEALAFYEEHGRPFSPIRDSSLIAGYKGFLEPFETLHQIEKPDISPAGERYTW
jgi:hypothetical protein